MSIAKLPESLSEQILAGIISVGKLGALRARAARRCLICAAAVLCVEKCEPVPTEDWPHPVPWVNVNRPGGV